MNNPELLNAYANLIQSLFPILVLYLIYKHRLGILNFIKDFRSDLEVDAFGIKAKLKGVSKRIEEFESTIPSDNARTSIEASQLREIEDKILEIASTSPKIAIVKLISEIERYLALTITRLGIVVPPHANMQELSKLLIDQNLLGRKQSELFAELLTEYEDSAKHELTNRTKHSYPEQQINLGLELLKIIDILGVELLNFKQGGQKNKRRR